jgi:hypothetical protein
LIVLAVPIGSDGLAGANRVASVIPNTVVLPPQSVNQIGQTLAAEVRRAGQDLLRARVAPEVAQPRLVGRLIESPQTVDFWRTTEVPVMLHSQASCVTYQTVAGADTAWVAIAPGDSLPTSLTVRSPRTWAEAWPWQAVHGGSGLPLHTQVAFAPSNQLVKMTVDPAPRMAEIPVAGVVRYPPMGWLSFAALLLPVVVLIWGLLLLIKWKTHRPLLLGRAIVRPHLDGGAEFDEQSIVFDGRRQNYSLRHPNGSTMLNLEARSERGRTVVYAVPGDLPVNVGGRRIAGAQPVRKVTRFESELGEITYYPR